MPKSKLWRGDPEQSKSELDERIKQGMDLAERLNPAPESEPQVEQPEAVATDEPTRYVRLNRMYQGRRSNEQCIEPGVYEKKDPRLFGAADYLVDNGHAEWVEVKG